MNGELIVVDDVAGEFAERVIESFLARRGEDFSLALSGGQTARECYERLAEVGGEQIDWWQVDIYWGDERCVPPDSEESNERLGRESLLERVGAARAVHPMRCDEGPESYQLRVGALGHLDVVHLGRGPDGHTASLFPNSPALDADPGLLVCLSDDPSGANPIQRMTLTFSGIARARLAVFTVTGAEKQEAMQKVYDGVDVPASRVRADQVIWLVDRDAAPRG